MGDSVATTDEDARLNRLVWKAIGKKSMKTLASELGVPAELLLQRKEELLEGVDDLTIQQHQQKLMVNLQDMADTAQEDYKSAPMEFKAGILNSAIAATKEVLKQLTAVSKQTDTRVLELNDLRIRELLRLVDTAVTEGVREIAGAKGLDEDELMGVFWRHLQASAKELDA